MTMTSRIGWLWLGIIIIVGLSHAAAETTTPIGHIPGGPNLSAGNLCDLSDSTTLVGEMNLSQDATLFEGFGSSAASKDYFIAGVAPSGVRRSLLKFDLASVGFPADMQVLCAEIRLSLNMDLSSSDAVPSEITLHEVTTDWSSSNNPGSSFDGLLNGGEAVEGDVTWEYSLYPTVRWSNMGGDFGGEPLSRQQKTVTNGNEYEWFGNTKRMHLLVDQWITDSSRNHGVLIKSGEGATDPIAYNVYHGAEASSDLVPKLMVVYTAPSFGYPHKGVANNNMVPTAMPTVDGQGNDDMLIGMPTDPPTVFFDDMLIGIPTDSPTMSPVVSPTTPPDNKVVGSNSDSDSDSEDDSTTSPFGFLRESNSNQEFTAVAVSITGIAIAAIIASMFGLLSDPIEEEEEEKEEGDTAMLDSSSVPPPPEVV